MDSMAHPTLRPETRRNAAALALAAAVAAAGCAVQEPRAPDPGDASEDVAPLDERVADAIRARAEAAGAAAAGTAAASMVGEETLRAFAQTAELYAARDYEPLWSDDGNVASDADSLLAVVAESASHGLAPADYHEGAAAALREAVAAAPDDPRVASRLADLDLLLTDAFVLLASDLRVGRVDPETIDPEWNAARPGNEPFETLESALKSGRVAAALRALAPRSSEYRDLREALARFRAAADEPWPPLGPGPTLKRGARDARIPALRARLHWTGDADSPLAPGVPVASGAPPDSAAAADPELFDDSLDFAVRSFQRSHGLPPDGVVGPVTFGELDVPPAVRARQIEANLERWRWLPREFERRHLRVNIAGFVLEAVEEGRVVLDMRIVAGKEYRRTPVFSGTMSYLVFSPYWNVPPLLANEDWVPSARKDPAALAAQGMRVLEGWGADEREVDPTTVDWAKVTPQNIRVHFRQDPGPANALGGVKFMFPNKFDVYLHDTPATDLFSRMPRDFSSGCIRLEKPAALAVYVLDDRKWDLERVKAAMRAGEEKTVRLRTKIPIHILYWTAWVDEHGKLQFRRDVYGRDATLLGALHGNPPL